MTGIGLVSALGRTVTQTWTNLLKGESAVQVQQPFEHFPALPLAMIGSQPADLYSLLLEAVDAAIADAGLQLPLVDAGVVVGSSRGHQAKMEAIAESWVSHGRIPFFPNWLEVLPHTVALTAARHVGSEGPVKAPMAACATGMMSLFQAWELVFRGDCDYALAAAVEAPITPLTLAGFERMGALATTGCYPFDCLREGLVLGEGAAVVLMESSTIARHRGAHVYGEVLGFGLSADGYHASAPDPQQQGSRVALETCLQRSLITIDEIGYIHAHGTSTKLNDAHEAALLQACGAQHIPTSSTKGATGHTLGASGLLGVVFCLLALRNQVVPPCVGLKQPAMPLNFVRKTTPLDLENALCLSFGFGGQNLAVALGRV